MSNAAATQPSAKAHPPQRRSAPPAPTEGDPLWYKNAVIYQLHVRSFCDSTTDGIGDFNGLITKLDYLADLGVTAVWILPFYPSPLRDDGYDIADYTAVNPSYGTMEDVKRFIDECHRRNMKVITELVVNHSSDQHPWFQRARRAPKGSPERDFYVWSDSPEKYAGTRIIFKDFEASNWTWDSVAQQYFWHRFYNHQPDLNFENEEVQKAVLETCSFWLKMGVDGMRLDAIPYLFERDGTSCENLPEGHVFLRRLRKHVDDNFPGRMLLAEANQWPEDAIKYFGEGDECQMSFHFPLMPRLFMALRMEDRYPIIDIMEQTPAIPSNCQWAVFLRNHDELTLEMVTDEERDYMYRVYASDTDARINLGIRRRLAPLLSNNRRKIELMNALLFSMPGTPIIYYGDEIGMGDNVRLGDRNGVRTPMQWSADRNAGFSRANPQKLFLPTIIDPEYHFETVNVESQQANPSSLLWWMKRLIALRKLYPVFGRGEMKFLQPDNPRVLAFLRTDGEQTVLVVANLSRFVQPFHLPMADLEGLRPIEMFGRIEFPRVTKDPYFLTLGPHGFYWFVLEKEGANANLDAAGGLPEITVPAPAERALSADSFVRDIDKLLPEMIKDRRWFSSKARTLRSAKVSDRLPLNVPGLANGTAAVALARCEFASGEAETYALPLIVQFTSESGPSPATMARLKAGSETRHDLIDGMSDPEFARTLLRLALSESNLTAGTSRFVGTRIGEGLSDAAIKELPARTPKLEQSNSTVFFGDKYMLKLFRRIEGGVNPELEIGRHLTDTPNFTGTAPLAGAVEIVDADGRKTTLAVISQLVSCEGDAWEWALGRVGQFMEAAASVPADQAERIFVLPPADAFSSTEPPIALKELLGEPLEGARLLGQRTAEMHAAMADDRGNAAFAPEEFSLMYQRSLFQTIRNTLRNTQAELAKAAGKCDASVQSMAQRIADSGEALLSNLGGLSKAAMSGAKIRVHGDYHLGQVLWTGRDFVIIDFEGEPMRSIGERRLKRSPLRDVAGMIRSFDYAAWSGWKKHASLMSAAGPARTTLASAAASWSAWMARAFTASYATTLDAINPELLGTDPSSRRLLLKIWTLEKALYEVNYELNARPDWVEIPLRAVSALLDETTNTPAPTSGKGASA